MKKKFAFTIYFTRKSNILYLKQLTTTIYCVIIQSQKENDVKINDFVSVKTD